MTKCSIQWKDKEQRTTEKTGIVIRVNIHIYAGVQLTRQMQKRGF